MDAIRKVAEKYIKSFLCNILTSDLKLQIWKTCNDYTIHRSPILIFIWK